MLVDLVCTTTRDGIRLDGVFQPATSPANSALPLDGVCLVHGTGGNFYSSTLFDSITERLLGRGCAVLRVNTRGHDLMSNATTTQGGRRLGAAYETVDDCRHDLVAWCNWLKERAGPRIGLIGHSLGAVKCIYTVAHEPALSVRCIVALSPPRLSYSHFCASPEGSQFLADYSRAERHIQAGQPMSLLDVKLPLPFVATAAGYAEKYGPLDRYDYVPLLRGFPSAVLVTLGSREVEGNMAFRGIPAELMALRDRHGRPDVEVVAGADHFYSGVREELLGLVEAWLSSALR